VTVSLARFVFLAAAVASVAACAAHSTAAIRPATLARANAACRRDNAKIAAFEERLSANFTAADVQSIEQEVSMLRRLGLDAPLHDAFVEVDRAFASLLSQTGSPGSANTHLQAAQKAAAQVGLHCSFGALPSRLFR